MIERDLGLWQDAERHFLASEEILRGMVPSQPERLSELTDHIALLRLHQGNVEAARRLLDESAQLRAEFLGQDWQGLIWTRHWKAIHALSTGDLATATDLLDIMLADYARYFGEPSHLLAYARSDRGYVALAAGQRGQARDLFEQSIERLQSLRAEGHPRLAEPLLGLALLAYAEGRHEEAQNAAQQALGLREALPLDSTGKAIWRGNACLVMNLLGAECRGAASAFGRDLDAVRLRRAIEGLCAGDDSGSPSLSDCAPR